MTTRLLRRAAALTALLVAAPVAATSLAPPALAADRTQVVPDAAGDGREGGAGDIGRVEVTRTDRRLVVRVLPASGGSIGRFYDVYLDHDPRDPGPEVRVSGDLYGEATSTSTAERFPRGAQPGPGRVLCRDLPFRRTGARERGAGVVLSAPLRCLGAAPERFRVSVRSSTDPGVVDWAPAPRRFSRVLGGPAAPAPAPAPARRPVRDRGGDDDSRVRADGISYGELRSLRTHWSRGRLVVRFVPTADTGAADAYDLYADTDGDGSPDVVVRWDRRRDVRFATAYRTDGYAPQPDPGAVLCARVPRRLVGGDRTAVGQEVVLLVPTSCLDRAGSVRVAGATTVSVGRTTQRADWAQAARRLSAAVARRQGGD